MDATPSLPSSDHCTLKHPVFTTVGDPLFRHAEADGAPVMVVKLGDKEAAIPLHSLSTSSPFPMIRTTAICWR